MTDNDTKPDGEVVPDWLIPSRVYDVLKWVALLVIPAVSVLVGTVGAAWGLPYTEPIVTTINAVGVAVGMLIGLSHITASKPSGR